MAIKRSAAKRLRQSEVRRLKNRMVRSEVRTEIKKFLSAVEAQDKEQAGAAFLVCQKIIDSAASKGVYHKANAARKKSRLHARLNAMA